MEAFDAVVFHIHNMDNGRIALPKQKLRKTNQLYIMFFLESPINSNFLYENFGNFFNW